MWILRIYSGELVKEFILCVVLQCQRSVENLVHQPIPLLGYGLPTQGI
jgi:hypothetical protein